MCLEAQHWTARERDTPEGSQPFNSDELGTFARELRDGFTATAIFAWTREKESEQINVAGGLGVEYAPARELLASLTGSEILGVMLVQPTAIVRIRDAAEVSNAAEELARFVTQQTPELERLADVDQLIKLLHQEHAVPFEAHMADFNDIHGTDPEPDAFEIPEAESDSDAVELMAALLAGAGRYDEARRVLVEDTQLVPEDEVSREHRRFVRQLTRFLDGELPLPTTPPRWPPGPLALEPTPTFSQVVLEKLPEARAQQDAVEAMRAISHGKTRGELRTLLEKELDERGAKLDPSAVETQVDLLATERKPFGKARIAMRGLKVLGEFAGLRREPVEPMAKRASRAADTEAVPASDDIRLELPERAAYPIVRDLNRRVVVELDPAARAWLDRVAQRVSQQGLRVVVVEVWLTWGIESSGTESHLNVYIGAERVGQLGPDVAEQLRLAMEAAAERDEDPWTHAFLSASSGTIPYVMEIPLPGDDI